jgi:uncharacterized protein
LEGISSWNTRKVVHADPVGSGGGRAIGSLILLLLWSVGARAQKTQADWNPNKPQMQAESTGNCHVGTYRLADGRDVDIAPYDENLRWRMRDGTSGERTPTPDGNWQSTLVWTGRSDGKTVSFGDCAEGKIDFDGIGGQRIVFDVSETSFQGAGVTLVGRLVMPKGKQRVPIVVLVHGSEQDSGLETLDLQRRFPSTGIGAFVYDKRGTGASGGKYTQNFLLRADDAIAAMREAKRLGGERAERIGYWGGSQGGWVAPLAAKIEPVDCVVVSFGLAVSPLEEDRSALALDVTRHGFGPDAVAKAMDVADATSVVLLSDFREGYDRVEAVRRKYESEPWFRYLHGDVSFLILQRSPATRAHAFSGCTAAI